MKILHIIPVIVACSLMACNDGTSKKPSIKENSNKIEETKVIEDYSNMSPEELHKHVLAHYNLGQFEVGKEKLKTLINDRPDLVDSLELMKLQQDFDIELNKIKEKEEQLAERKRRERMPNATENMRTFDKDKITYYVDKSSPKFDSKETFHAYYTKDKLGAVRLYLKVRYVSTDWLNIENYMVTVDQLDYEISGDVVKHETKGKKKYKQEILDEEIDTYGELMLINAIANGSEIKAVYVGKNTYKERAITKEQQVAVRNVIDAYLFFIEKDMSDLKKRYASK